MLNRWANGYSNHFCESDRKPPSDFSRLWIKPSDLNYYAFSTSLQRAMMGPCSESEMYLCICSHKRSESYKHHLDCCFVRLYFMQMQPSNSDCKNPIVAADSGLDPYSVVLWSQKRLDQALPMLLHNKIIEPIVQVYTCYNCIAITFCQLSQINSYLQGMHPWPMRRLMVS